MPLTARGLANWRVVAVVGMMGVAETVEEQVPVPIMVLIIPEGVTLLTVQRVESGTNI